MIFIKVQNITLKYFKDLGVKKYKTKYEIVQDSLSTQRPKRDPALQFWDQILFLNFIQAVLFWWQIKSVLTAVGACYINLCAHGRRGSLFPLSVKGSRDFLINSGFSGQ